MNQTLLQPQMPALLDLQDKCLPASASQVPRPPTLGFLRNVGVLINWGSEIFLKPSKRGS